MKEHPNFYENIKEAHMRLVNTVVLYDGEPYYILTITDHNPDGVFRVYMDPLGRPEGLVHQNHEVPYEWYDEPGMSRGQKMDQWLEKNEKLGIIRKMMNSPKFNRFRPFPLGMCNIVGRVYYVERGPVRHTQQGLMQTMLNSTPLALDYQSVPGASKRSSASPNIFSVDFYNTIMGKYPTARECLDNLNDPKIGNEGAAFSRNFCFVRGPLDMMFLGYKEDIVGYLPHSDFDEIRLGKQFGHVREAVSELELFNSVK